MSSTDVTGFPHSVYRYFDHAGRLIYVGITARGMQRQREHNQSSAWFAYANSQTIEHHPDRETARAVEAELIRTHRPPFNKVHNEDWDLVRDAYLSLLAAENYLKALQNRELSCECGERYCPKSLGCNIEGAHIDGWRAGADYGHAKAFEETRLGLLPELEWLTGHGLDQENPRRASFVMDAPEGRDAALSALAETGARR